MSGDSPVKVEDSMGSQGLLSLCFLSPKLSTESFKNHVQDTKNTKTLPL